MRFVYPPYIDASHVGWISEAHPPNSPIMSQYHRAYITGGVYFFTVITYRRAAIFTTEDRVEILQICISKSFYNTIYLTLYILNLSPEKYEKV